ncbi:MAG: NAD-dependent epimerase/dehydratase family protein [Nitriliruptoraceae bacterium]
MDGPTGSERVAAAFAGHRALVTGGAGFLGSYVCRKLLDAGLDVWAIDSFITGRQSNVADLADDVRFTLVNGDVINHIAVPDDVAVVLHLASPASPIDYLRHPIHTLKVGSIGTLNALGVARARGARFMLASTSEVYGDPEVHPQPESYLGNVDAIGPRGVYDEAKRFAEAMTYAYHRDHGVDVRVARIFNTYGPGMRHDDGRLVPTFVGQALRGEPITVQGDGSQTRSLCFVDDLVDGMLRLLVSDRILPCNLGSEVEVTVSEVASMVRSLADVDVPIVHVDRPTADPQRRRPDLSVAKAHLSWAPTVDLADGLGRTIDWARADLDVDP